MNLMEQFYRIVNIWFLILAVLATTPLSPQVLICFFFIAADETFFAAEAGDPDFPTLLRADLPRD